MRSLLRPLAIPAALLVLALLLVGAAYLLRDAPGDVTDSSEHLAGLGLMLEDGGSLEVLAVRDRSPAARAGFQPGDRLVTFGGAAIAGIEQLESALAGCTAPQPLSFDVLRDGETLRLTIARRRKSP